MQKFLQIACQADRQQYERFVVIKEATGNLFAVSFISLFVGIVSIAINNVGKDFVSGAVEDVKSAFRFGSSIIIITIFLVGLKLMNDEHIFKQYDFAATFVATPHQGCPADETLNKK